MNAALEASTHNLKATLELLSERDMKEAVELLADVRRRIMVLGGRVSATLARYLVERGHDYYLASASVSTADGTW